LGSWVGPYSFGKFESTLVSLWRLLLEDKDEVCDLTSSSSSSDAIDE